MNIVINAAVNIRTKQILTSVLTGLVLTLLCMNVQAAKPVKDSSLGLSKTSVNDSPEPEKFGYSNNFPGTGNLLPRAYLNAPPQIPHNIEAFLPVGKARNMCKVCHDKRDTLGKTGKAEKVRGQPTAISASHYVDHRLDTGKIGKSLVGARTVCTQCHVPQANVKPLVTNTFDD
jgi:cytochrome c-type protein NapB